MSDERNMGSHHETDTEGLNDHQKKHGNSYTTEKPSKEAASKVFKNLDNYRTDQEINDLRHQGYEIDYDRLAQVGANSVIFLAHLINAPTQQIEKSNLNRPSYIPRYDIAVKIVADNHQIGRRRAKMRMGNLKLALALGQTDPSNNILRVMDVFRTAERIFIFMQYCPYGSIFSFMRRHGLVAGKLARSWSIQMAGALCFLHKFHVAHRNYKLENVLVDENLNAKLTGFSSSKCCVNPITKRPVFSKTICGSQPYLAPELLVEPSGRFYDPKLADVWAFGVGLYLCLTHNYPFQSTTLSGLKEEQLMARYLVLDTHKRICPPVRALLEDLFTLDPNNRPTMQEVLKKSIWLSDKAVADRNLVHEATMTSSVHNKQTANLKPLVPALPVEAGVETQNSMDKIDIYQSLVD